MIYTVYILDRTRGHSMPRGRGSMGPGLGLRPRGPGPDPGSQGQAQGPRTQGSGAHLSTKAPGTGLACSASGDRRIGFFNHLLYIIYIYIYIYICIFILLLHKIICARFRALLPLTRMSTSIGVHKRLQRMSTSTGTIGCTGPVGSIGHHREL